MAPEDAVTEDFHSTSMIATLSAVVVLAPRPDPVLEHLDELQVGVLYQRP